MGQHQYSPYRKLRSVSVGDVRWTVGFWADRFEICHGSVLPSTWQAMHTPGNAAVFSNLYVAAGLQEGMHTGTNWSDGDCYKWMEAAAHIYGITQDPQLDGRLDELIDIVAKAQEPDGYICTQVQLNPAKERWQRRNYHELYNMGHLLTAASVHHRVTGKTSFLDIAVKLADYLYAVFGPRPADLVHFGWNPSNIMGLIDLYRQTGDTRYMELAGTFVDMRGSRPQDFAHKGDYVLWDGGDQNQDRVPLRKETEAVGHVVTATYLYCGATDVYAETGEQSLVDALERLWRNMVNKMYITGAAAALHHGSSIRRDPVHEAFGRAYQLPNASAYNETCANIGNAMWNWRMLELAGETRYTELMERVVYNSGLSPMSIDGTRFFYTNPLQWHGPEHQLLSQDTQERWFTHNCYCCPPQVARFIAWLQDWAYSLSEEGVWVHLYGSNTLQTTLDNGSSLKLTQETDYPWNGEVRIVIESAPESPFAVMLRIPGWATDARLEVNGVKASVKAAPATYAVLERRWTPGDVIALSLPMAARLVRAHHKVEETRNQVAVMRGPIVYCLESLDLPEGVRVSEVHLPRHIQLTPKHVPQLLGGVTVLEGKACRIHQRDDRDTLYSDLGDERIEKVPITLIPYYAWNNRGTPQMTVWLPLC